MLWKVLFRKGVPVKFDNVTWESHPYKMGRVRIQEMSEGFKITGGACQVESYLSQFNFIIDAIEDSAPKVSECECQDLFGRTADRSGLCSVWIVRICTTDER